MNRNDCDGRGWGDWIHVSNLEPLIAAPPGTYVQFESSSGSHWTLIKGTSDYATFSPGGSTHYRIEKTDKTPQETVDKPGAGDFQRWAVPVVWTPKTGEICPVHPDTMVECITRNGWQWAADRAGDLRWATSVMQLEGDIMFWRFADATV